MSFALYRLGRFAVRRRGRVLAAWAIALVALGVVAGRFGGEPSQSLSIPGSETDEAFALLDARFPEQTGEDARIVFAAPKGHRIDEGAARRAVAKVLRTVAGQPGVRAVVDPLTNAGAGQTSRDGRIAFATVHYGGNHSEVGRDAVDRLEAAIRPAEAAGLHVALGGDVVEFNSSDVGGLSEVVGLGVAIVVLLVAFGSVVAMGLPIITALLALGAGLLLVTMAARFSAIPDFAPTMASMIGLGVGIDYALFLVTRHREGLARGMTVEESVGRATATSGQAVVIAGATVVIAILGLQAVDIPFVSGLGVASSIVVAVSVVAAVTLLPALLGIAGRGIERLRLPARRRPAGHRTLSGRWARRVSRNPWPYLLASLALLATLTIPFFSIRLGQNDAGTLPESSTVRQAYDLLADGFGPGFNGPLVVAIDLARTPRADRAEVLDRVGQAVGTDAGVAAVVPAQPNAAGDAAVLTAFPVSAPQDAATEQTIHRLRGEVLDRATAGTGARAYLTGSTAAFIDISDKIQERLPWFVGTVVVLSFLLLLVVFRSILVPVKAALMNLLGIGASYGVIVAIFQWGWLKDLVGLEETVPILSFLPLFMFAILFGLSMDYEVFLMSRIREEYLLDRDNLRSVEAGIASTARVITAAAVIMISVFASFALNGDVAVKMSGIGLATAILLDATVIRLALVPATMAVAGRANWWFPAWLDRVLPRIDIEGEHGLPEPERQWADHPAVTDRPARRHLKSPRRPERV